MIEYRYLNSNDIDSMFVIENECFVDPYKKEDLFYELNENPVNKIIGVFDDDKLIGFIDYMITFNSSTITQVAVTSSYRRKGIANELIKKMIESFPKDIDDMVETITLEVRESNEAAKNLYLKNGFEIVVLKKNYYKDGENAIYMVKRLI